MRRPGGASRWAGPRHSMRGRRANWPSGCGAVRSRADFRPELWTLQRIGALIERDFGVRFSTANVWLLLRSLGFSSQRPVGRAIQRDEAAILDWKKRRWPALKKSVSAKAARSSSSTSRD